MKSKILKTSQQFLSLYKFFLLRLISAYGSWQNRNIFNNIEQYCMFIGYPRSGHSLVGALLDAHPNIIIGNELNALKYLQKGFTKQQIYYLLLQYSQYFSQPKNCLIPSEYIPKGRRKYIIPNQWNGNFSTIRIIGDKKGGGSTLILQKHQQLLQKIQQTIQIPIKFIHVVRNLYDNIATISRKNLSKGLQGSMERYFSLCESNSQIIQTIKPENLFQLRLENLISNPQSTLKEITENFLGMQANDTYIEECANFIFQSPNKSRSQVNWNQELIHVIQEKIDSINFLNGYSFYN